MDDGSEGRRWAQARSHSFGSTEPPRDPRRLHRLNGDSNVAFFKQLKSNGLDATSMPTLSVSIAEEEVRGIGAENLAGHLVAWNYYQTTETQRTRSLPPPSRPGTWRTG